MRRALVCNRCGREYAEGPKWLCDGCFGLLDVKYTAEGKRLTKAELAGRERSMWRYVERLPVESPSSIKTGWTRLVEGRRLGEALGLSRLYIKDEGTSFPTGRYEDRLAAVAVAKAGELGFEVVACATLGKLAGSVAAACAAGGVPCYIFAPVDNDMRQLSRGISAGARVVLVEGREEEAAWFCREAAEEYGWAFVNLQLKPFWAEAAKTLVFEVAEQLGWRLPGQLVMPMASGLLAKKSAEAREELSALGFIDGASNVMKIFGVQTESCAPIARALREGLENVRPWGNSSSAAPADPPWGEEAVRAVRGSGGGGAVVTEEEAGKGRELLAKTEGMVRGAESGAAVWGVKRLTEEGKLQEDELTVLAVTGRPPEASVAGRKPLRRIRPRLSDLDKLLRIGFE